MNAFTKSYFDLTPTDIAELSERLLDHPVIKAQAAKQGSSREQMISETLGMWRSGELNAVHNAVGDIIGFG